MSYRNDRDALQARRVALDADIARLVRERDEVLDLLGPRPVPRRRRRSADAIAAALVALVFGTAVIVSLSSHDASRDKPAPEPEDYALCRAATQDSTAAHERAQRICYPDAP